MRTEPCMKCGSAVEVDPDFEYEFCCPVVTQTMPCGCMGMPLNPVICEKCDTRILDFRMEFP